MIDLGVYVAIASNGKKPLKLIEKEDRYHEIVNYLFLRYKMDFIPSEKDEIFISEWVKYVNSESENCSRYDALKKKIIAKYGADFFGVILYEHLHLLQRTDIRNKIIKGERKSII